MSQTLQNHIVFADGACSGNPGPGGWGAVIVTPQGQVAELGARDPQTTNNRMELEAVIAALDFLRGQPGDISIYTDSVYVIKGITQWIWAWRNRGWKTAEGAEVANREEWERLFKAVASRRPHKVDWKWVKGHSGVPGNERVDEIAVGFTQGRRPSLYRGPLLQYEVAIHDLPEDAPVPDRPKGSKEKTPAFSYLSSVNGVTRRHSTWKECEAVVKGRPGARFQKATSAQDEAAILKKWGVKPPS